MRRRLLGLAACMLLALTSDALGQERRLKLDVVSIAEEVSSFLGWVSYSGSVINNGDRIIKYPKVVFTLKLGDKVVDVRSAYVDGPGGHELGPGEIGFFERMTLMTKADFDSYTITFDGRLDAAGASFVTGDILMIEESLNVMEYAGDAAIFGQFTNGTNAVITDVSLRFFLYDAAGALVGFAEANYSLPNEIYPDELVPFRATSDADFEAVASWTATWEFTADRIPQDFPTGVEISSWGVVKNTR